MLKTMHLLAVYLIIIIMHNGIDKDYVTIFYSYIHVIDLFSPQGYDKRL